MVSNENKRDNNSQMSNFKRLELTCIISSIFFNYLNLCLKYY